MDDDVRRLLDIEAIKQFKARYFRLLDAQDWEQFRELFTDDLEFFFATPRAGMHPPEAVYLPNGKAQVTRDQLLAWLESSSPGMATVHHSHDPIITFDGPDSAHGSWLMTDYTLWTGPDGVPRGMRSYGGHEETYRRTGDGWCICRSEFSRYDLDLFDVMPPTKP